MDSNVASHKGQAIGQLEAAVLQGLALADAGQTQGCLMDQLQGQAGFDAGARLPAPATEKIPGPQAQVFGDEEPEADQITGDAVSQSLADTVLQRRRITRTQTPSASRGVGIDRGGGTGTALIEFFFADRIRQ